MRRAISAAIVIASLLLGGRAGAEQAPLRKYDTPYYILYTDVDRDEAMEAAIRMTQIAEEYIERTRGFAGQFRERLSFYLYRNSADYFADGAPAGSAGVFIIDGADTKLMAIAGKPTSEYTWHVVQHEAFHQFAHATMNGDLPAWVDEGMAEYCGEGLWTGDNFYLGAVPQDRLERIREGIKAKSFKPVKEMMLLSQREWNKAADIANYDQAWSMAHFLLNAENGKYQALFNRFMVAVSRAVPWQKAWVEAFGPDINGFETQWRDYWLKLPDDPTAELYSAATVATLTSALARGQLLKQSYRSADALIEALAAGDLEKPLEKLFPNNWLPPALLKAAAGRAAKMGTWILESGPGRLPRLTCVLDGSRRLVGSYAMVNGHVKVTVEVPKTPTTRKAGKPS